jgi:hypothetical protein
MFMILLTLTTTRSFNGLRMLGEKYNTGVHGVIRHLAHNAVENAQHKSKAA